MDMKLAQEYIAAKDAKMHAFNAWENANMALTKAYNDSEKITK